MVECFDCGDGPCYMNCGPVVTVSDKAKEDGLSVDEIIAALEMATQQIRDSKRP